MNMPHFNENPGFAMQPNFNQRNYYIMQQQVKAKVCYKTTSMVLSSFFVAGILSILRCG